MLKFNSGWRFDSPGRIREEVVQEFYEIIGKVARGEQKILECFKTYFASASGSTSSWSSNASWAASDLRSFMDHSSDNAPLFIEAFYDACEDLKKNQGLPVPEHNQINRILSNHKAGYQIEPPNLITLNSEYIPTPEIPLSLDEKAQEVIHKSFSESQKLLSEGRHRQAVQEILWLLETVSTAFQGLNSGEDNSIEGKYFNKIIDELRRHNQGTSLDQIISWIKNLHGYLSAPSGGGIRHGMNLKDGVATAEGEAKLYCNLITSYISFLLAEYERLSRHASWY